MDLKQANDTLNNLVIKLADARNPWLKPKRRRATMRSTPTPATFKRGRLWMG